MTESHEQADILGSTCERFQILREILRLQPQQASCESIYFESERATGRDCRLTDD